MLVNTLEQAEQIVAKHSFLEWDGWNIIRYTPDPAGFYARDGVWHNERWQRKTCYELNRQGWHLPHTLVKT